MPLFTPQSRSHRATLQPPTNVRPQVCPHGQAGTAAQGAGGRGRPGWRARLSTALLAVGLLAAAGASAATLGGPSSTSPAIAIDPGAQTGLAVYEQNGRIYAKRIDAEGRVLDAGGRPLPFSGTSGGTRYRDPSIVFKQPQNRWYIAASRQTTLTLNWPNNPQSFLVANGIEVVALDRALNRVGTIFVGTPGQRPQIGNPDGERYPALAASDGTGDCCVGITWQDVRDSTRIFVASLKSDLSGTHGVELGFDTLRLYSSDPAIAYDSGNNRFVIAYDTCRYPGRECDVGILSVAERTLAARTQVMLPRAGKGVPTRPSIAFVSGTSLLTHRLLVASNRVAINPDGSEDISVRLNTLVDNGSSLQRVAASDRLVYNPGGTWGALLANRAKNEARVTDMGDGRRVLIVASGSSAYSTNQLISFTVDVNSLATGSTRRITDTLPRPTHAGLGFLAASGRALFVWQQTGTTAGTSVGVFAP